MVTCGSSVLRRPTDHFKDYCGSGWLTREGLISEKEAIEFVRYHSRTLENDGVIKLNDWLRCLINENRYEMYIAELPVIVQRFFK